MRYEIDLIGSFDIEVWRKISSFEVSFRDKDYVRLSDSEWVTKRAWEFRREPGVVKVREVPRSELFPEQEAESDD